MASPFIFRRSYVYKNNQITYLHDLSSKPEKPGTDEYVECVVGCCDETNGYILLVGGEFALLSLPVNGEPSEFGVADTDDEELL